jgi:hypothetical protein
MKIKKRYPNLNYEQVTDTLNLIKQVVEENNCKTYLDIKNNLFKKEYKHHQLISNNHLLGFLRKNNVIYLDKVSPKKKFYKWNPCIPVDSSLITNCKDYLDSKSRVIKNTEKAIDKKPEIKNEKKTLSLFWGLITIKY